jgi:hypothetical protein
MTYYLSGKIGVTFTFYTKYLIEQVYEYLHYLLPHRCLEKNTNHYQFLRGYARLQQKGLFVTV